MSELFVLGLYVVSDHVVVGTEYSDVRRRSMRGSDREGLSERCVYCLLDLIIIKNP